MSLRRKLLTVRPIVWLASIKITLVCLLLLFFLTLGGTVAQISDGLYLAQERYFESFFFLLFGFLPFPGAQLVMWVLFVNLVCVALIRFTPQLRQAGIMIIHTGLLLFLISAYITLHSTTESQVTLAEGQASNVSLAYHDWEIALWEDVTQKDPSKRQRDIVSIDPLTMKLEQSYPVSEFDLNLKLKKYYRNCQITRRSGEVMEFEELELSPEAEKNSPCAVVSYEAKGQAPADIYLHGDFDVARTIRLGDKKVSALLRLKRYPLPFIIKLIDFKKEEHPGTTTPRSFESLVEVIENGAGREKLIKMNEPLRFNEYTLYQASFTDSGRGRETSTFAVVRNSGRIMPYVSTFVTFFGLALHFGMAAILSKRKKHA